VALRYALLRFMFCLPFAVQEFVVSGPAPGPATTGTRTGRVPVY